MTTEPTPAHGPSESITETPAAAAPTPAPSTAITETPAAATPPTPAPAIGNQTPPDWTLRADYFLLALLLTLSFFLASFAATNTDLWMHFAIGKRVSEGTLEFGVDPFSWATEATGDKPAVRWVHHSWIYSWFVFKLHDSGDALVLIKAILFTLAIGLLSRIGWNSPSRWFVLISLLMAVLAASSRLFLDPTVISLLFLAGTLFILDRAGMFAVLLPSPPGRGAGGEGDDPTRWLWSLPPLFFVWANLDAWFILGPIVLGLVWAASGLSRWFVSVRGLPGKQLGMVFGASVLACLLNRHGIYVFQLPPELAYLVLSIADPIHLPLPDWLIAGGRTLKELRRLEPGFDVTLSSVTNAYWWEPRYGKNVAGLAFYPLLLLGLLAFTLMALVKPQPDAPSFHVGRFLIWLVFGVMALSLYRLVPFFALAAAPLTALTLGEFVAWQQRNSVTPIERRDRGLTFARVASVPFLLMFLCLAWPGWLHGTTDFNSPRRVAWQVRENGSLKKAALTLNALNEAGEGNNVFNADREFGNVVSWYAPGVKHATDTRFALFAAQVDPMAKVRDAVNGEKAEVDWQKVFAEHKVDQIAMSNFLAKESGARVMRWWLAPHEYRQRFGNLRIIVFSHAPPDRRWPRSQVTIDLNRDAFGEIPETRRPPKKGTLPPPQTPGFMGLYLDGIPPTPSSLSEIDLLQERFVLINQLSHGNSRHVRLFGLWSSLAPLQGMPGGMTLDGCFATMYAGWLSSPTGGDFGPPAAPVLMVRTARQAVAENPLDYRTHLQLIKAHDVVRHLQEDHWTGYQQGDALGEARKNMHGWEQVFLDSVYRRKHPAALRDRMRQVQQLTGTFTIVQLQPDVFIHHHRLADFYLKEQFLDLALEHMQLAEKCLETKRPTDSADAIKQFDREVKQYKDEVANLEKDVKQRVSKWKDLSVGKSAFHKAILAYQGPFLNTPLSLGKKSLELLGTVKMEDLNEDERLIYVKMRYDLLIAMGRVDLVAESLSDAHIKKNMPAGMYAEYQLYAAAAIGDYEKMDEALATRTKALDAELKLIQTAVEQRNRDLVLHAFALGTQPTTSAACLPLRMIPGVLHTGESYGKSQLFKAGLGNERTLHGIILLEAGNTAKARILFEQAMNDGEGNRFFSERAIARRYLELLNEQKK